MLLKQRGKFYILKKGLQNPEMLKLSKLSQFVWGKGALQGYFLITWTFPELPRQRETQAFRRISRLGKLSKLSKFRGSIGPNYPNRPRKPWRQLWRLTSSQSGGPFFLGMLKFPDVSVTSSQNNKNLRQPQMRRTGFEEKNGFWRVGIEYYEVRLAKYAPTKGTWNMYISKTPKTQLQHLDGDMHISWENITNMTVSCLRWFWLLCWLSFERKSQTEKDWRLTPQLHDSYSLQVASPKMTQLMESHTMHANVTTPRARCCMAVLDLCLYILEVTLPSKTFACLFGCK